MQLWDAQEGEMLALVDVLVIQRVWASRDKSSDMNEKGKKGNGNGHLCFCVCGLFPWTPSLMTLDDAAELRWQGGADTVDFQGEDADDYFIAEFDLRSHMERTEQQFKETAQLQSDAIQKDLQKSERDCRHNAYECAEGENLTTPCWC